MKVIYIMWLRQWKRYIRKKSRIIGSLGQPILFLFALGFGLGPIFKAAGGIDYIQFLTPGVIAMTVLFTSVFSGLEIIWDKQFGFMKETLVAPVTRFQILLGKTLGGATISAIQGFLVFAIAFTVGFRPADYSMLPLALLFLLLIALLFSALGAVIAARLDDMQGFPLIINFVIQPLFFLSGALFPLDNIPTALKFITSVNPLSYGVEGLRFAFSGEAFLNPFISIIVLIFVTVLVMIVGVYQFSKIEV